IEQREDRYGLAAPALAGHTEHLAGCNVVVDAIDHCDQAGRSWQPHPQPSNREQSVHRFCSLTAHDVRGSSASRRLSPRKLKASTTDRIAKPGNVPIHQNSKYCVPVLTIDPRSGFGGWAPSPRKDRPASSSTALPRSSVAS